jgi:Spy/CpxP family protein refolding chaperone
LIDSLSFDHVSRLGRFLDLDRQQEERFSRLRRNLLPQILSARDEVRALRRRIHEQYRRAEVDSPEVRGLVARLAETQSRLDSLAAEAMLREAMLLTPAQRVRYFESMRWGAELCERPGSR